MVNGNVTIEDVLKEDAMKHVTESGTINEYEVPGGIRIKLLDVCNFFRLELIREDSHAEDLIKNLAVKWKLKLFEGLVLRIGRNNLNFNEVKVENVEGVYKATCPVCNCSIIIQEKLRNVIYPKTFYAHVETHFDESSDEIESPQSSTSTTIQQPPAKRRSLRNNNVSL